MTLSTILTTIGDIFLEVMTWMQTIAAVIMGGTVGTGETAVTYEPNYLFLFMILFGFIFAGVRMFRKILNL